jgi:hypothetical protein
VDSAIATVWRIEGYDAFTANPGEDARPALNSGSTHRRGLAGVLAVVRATSAPAAANFKKLRESGNIVESPSEWLFKVILSMEEILPARSDLRGGD